MIASLSRNELFISQPLQNAQKIQANWQSIYFYSFCVSVLWKNQPELKKFELLLTFYFYLFLLFIKFLLLNWIAKLDILGTDIFHGGYIFFDNKGTNFLETLETIMIFIPVFAIFCKMIAYNKWFAKISWIFFP